MPIDIRSESDRSLASYATISAVPACRLYGAHGYRLREVTVPAYRDVPGEAKLTWERTVRPAI